MDYTGKYLAMCKNAHPLQENVKELLPNAYGALFIGENGKMNLHKKSDPEDLNDAGISWIPRLDEMITIMKWQSKFCGEMRRCLNDEVNFPFIKTFGTLEKMLLSVVMFYEYNLEWDDENLCWVDVKMYGIGTNSGSEKKPSWGVIAGPTRDLKDLINHPLHPEALKDSDNWYVVNLVTNKPVYKWNISEDKWKIIE